MTDRLDPETDDLDLFLQSPFVEVRRVSNRGTGGRCVLARIDIPKDTTFERVPVLLVPHRQVFGSVEARRRSAAISWYVFDWLPMDEPHVALSLGYGSIYNHSDTPNARYEATLPDVMHFVANRDIRAGEEITISYRANPEHDLGFSPRIDVPS